MIITRRSFLTGLMAAPIIVAAPSLMTVKPVRFMHTFGWIEVASPPVIMPIPFGPMVAEHAQWISDLCHQIYQDMMVDLEHVSGPTNFNEFFARNT